MATYPLVEPGIDRDLPALIALSLEKHRVPVTSRFWMRSESGGVSQVVVISEAVDRLGTREAYRSVFAVLDKETFSTKSFLGSHLLLLGEKETRGVRDLLAKGTSRLPALGPFEDVDVYPVPEAEKIRKQGFLHFTPANNNPSCQVSFSPLDRDGAAKPLQAAVKDLDAILSFFSYSQADKEKALESLGHHRSASILAQTNLQKLYESGLI